MDERRKQANSRPAVGRDLKPHTDEAEMSDARMTGIVNLRLTKCEMLPYRVFGKIVSAICCRHVRL